MADDPATWAGELCFAMAERAPEPGVLLRTTIKSDASRTTGASLALWMKKRCREQVAAPEHARRPALVLGRVSRLGRRCAPLGAGRKSMRYGMVAAILLAPGGEAVVRVGVDLAHLPRGGPAVRAVLHSLPIHAPPALSRGFWRPHEASASDKGSRASAAPMRTRGQCRSSLAQGATDRRDRRVATVRSWRHRPRLTRTPGRYRRSGAGSGKPGLP